MFRRAVVAGLCAFVGAGVVQVNVALADEAVVGNTSTVQDPNVVIQAGQPADKRARQMLAYVNVERLRHGCRPLKLNERLTVAATHHSTAMGRDDFYAHVGVDGSTLSGRVREAGYIYLLLAENIAVAFATPQEAVTGWMNSPGHRANMLNCAYKEIGIGYYYQPGDKPMDGNVYPYYTYWTQVFGRQARFGTETPANPAIQVKATVPIDAVAELLGTEPTVQATPAAAMVMPVLTQPTEAVVTETVMATATIPAPTGRSLKPFVARIDSGLLLPMAPEKTYAALTVQDEAEQAATQAALAAVNAERAKAGCQALTFEPRLVSAAQAQSDAMAEQDFLAQMGPDGLTGTLRTKATGYEYGRIVEQINAGSASPDATVAYWANTPGFREHVLNRNYTHAGIGFTYQPDDKPLAGNQVAYSYYWVQIMATPLARGGPPPVPARRIEIAKEDVPGAVASLAGLGLGALP